MTHTLGRPSRLARLTALGALDDIRLIRLNATTVRVIDSGATVTPGTRCVRVSEHEARCANSRSEQGGLIRLGDGNDRANGRTRGRRTGWLPA